MIRVPVPESTRDEAYCAGQCQWASGPASALIAAFAARQHVRQTGHPARVRKQTVSEYRPVTHG